MILSIHRANNSVGIDRRILTVDCSALDPTISVVHWSGPEGGEGKGWIEFVYDPHAGSHRPNEQINSAAPYQAIVAAWRAQARAIDSAPPIEQTWDFIRARRDAKLGVTDWMLMPDAPPLTAASRAALLAYRQALRDVPQAFATVADVVWPAPPVYATAAPNRG